MLFFFFLLSIAAESESFCPTHKSLQDRGIGSSWGLLLIFWLLFFSETEQAVFFFCLNKLQEKHEAGQKLFTAVQTCFRDAAED